MKILVAGGAGFMGSNFIHYMLKKYSDYKIICVDCLLYAGSTSTLDLVLNNPRFEFYKADICDREAVNMIFKKSKPDIVVNFVNEQTYDKLINDPKKCFKINTVGTNILLDTCKKYGNIRYHQVSTDEVYKYLSVDKSEIFFADYKNKPTNYNYVSSKAGADMIVMSYYKMHGLPVTVSVCENAYGPYQFPKAFIPSLITGILNEKEVRISKCGSDKNSWLYVDDHSKAVDNIIHNGKLGGIYNINSDNKISNTKIAKYISKKLQKSESCVVYAKESKNNNDIKSYDMSKIYCEFDLKPEINIEEGLEKTIKWYVDNRKWWENIISDEYIKYCENMYKNM